MATMVAGTGVFAILFYLFYEEIRAMQRENAEEQMRVSVARGKSSELIEQISRAEGRLRNAEQAWHNERQKFQRLKAELEQLRARMEPADLDHFGLSPREKDVLKLLVETKASNKQIGVLLDITERTVKSHIYSICNKTGVDRRVELIELFRWNSWAETDSRREQC
jgi:DNA-binding CsgD family transcriptional regulator